jgi:arylsulfatase A-like enzyme
MYDPADVALPIAAGDHLHPSQRLFLQVPDATAPTDEDELRHMRAQYYGMISEVDSQLARVWQALRDGDMWDDTLIIVTADHGEQLGDHGLQQKLVAAFSSRATTSSASSGTRGTRRHTAPRSTPHREHRPLPHHVRRHRRAGARAVRRSTTHAVPVRRGATCGARRPTGVRLARCVHRRQPAHWPWDRRLERQHVVTLRTADTAYVQFADGSSRCYDLAADPTWRTEINDPAVILPLAQQMLVWRSRHADRTMTDMLVKDGGVGRFPAEPMFVATPLP